MILFFLPTVLASQSVQAVFSTDSALYSFALKRFAQAFDEHSIWLETNAVYDFYIKDSMPDLKVKKIDQFNYLEGLKKKKLKEVVKMIPVRHKGDHFEISIIKFKLEYFRKKRLFRFTNEGGITIIFKFDCLKNEYIYQSESTGH